MANLAGVCKDNPENSYSSIHNTFDKWTGLSTGITDELSGDNHVCHVFVGNKSAWNQFIGGKYEHDFDNITHEYNLPEDTFILEYKIHSEDETIYWVQPAPSYNRTDAITMSVVLKPDPDPDPEPVQDSSARNLLASFQAQQALPPPSSVINACTSPNNFYFNIWVNF